MPSPRQLKGASGEAIAARFLEAKGYRILDRNYRFRKAEVDLIAEAPRAQGEEGTTLVFVEVKWRARSAFAAPEAAVNGSKQRLLVMAAEAYLRPHEPQNTSCRFDIVTLLGSNPRIVVEHFEGAFHA